MLLGRKRGEEEVMEGGEAKLTSSGLSGANISSIRYHQHQQRRQRHCVVVLVVLVVVLCVRVVWRVGVCVRVR